MRPTFLGIGAQKAASSWLYDILADHPEVALSEQKELDFFSYHYENGLRWYESQFPDRPSTVQRGEISPSYLHEPAAAHRAFAYEPDLRLLVSLRDPVERALSQHRHLVRLGVVPADDLSFDRALETNPTYVQQGCYHEHLLRWVSLFGQARIHVVLMEDIRADPSRVAEDLFAFLGVDREHRPGALTTVSNPSYVPRSRGVEAAIRVLRNSVAAAGAGKVWQMIGDTGLRNVYRRVNRQPSTAVIPPPRPETLARLRCTFRPDTEKLAELLQRDLSSWM